MKRVFSILLATVMAVSMMAVPAFAASEPVEDPDHGSYDWSATGVEVVTGKDKSGNSVWVRGTSNNSPVKELSECPKMDYVKTIDGVTFSNYIHHTTANTKDAAGNTITIYKVYIGLNGAIRSDKGNVEFMTSPSTPFNYQNDALVKTHNGAVNPCMDMNHYKTNTVRFKDSIRNTYSSLSDIGITPYADGGNYGRANDGTWKSGLTWVFGRYQSGEKSNGSYGAIYPIRVNQGDTVTYFQVSVTDATNYSGQRVTESNPVTPAPSTDPVTVAPAKEATAQPTTSPIYINNVKTNFEAYNINGNNYFKLRDVALALRGTQKQFEVGWDGEKNAISLSSKTPYSGKAGTVSTSKQQRKASRTNSAIYVDGVKKDFTAYQINGNNFFKLRDLGQTLDFNVGWDSATQSVTIDTTRDY